MLVLWVIEVFGQRKRLRRLAAQVLLAWLFALTSSVVNACVIEPDLRHEAVSSLQSSHGAAPSPGHLHTEQAPGHAHPDSHADKAPCAKFCDDESTSVPTIRQLVNPLGTVWLAPPPNAGLPVQSALESVGAFRVERGSQRARIPILFAFLRLTL